MRFNMKSILLYQLSVDLSTHLYINDVDYGRELIQRSVKTLRSDGAWAIPYFKRNDCASTSHIQRWPGRNDKNGRTRTEV